MFLQGRPLWAYSDYNMIYICICVLLSVLISWCVYLRNYMNWCVAIKFIALYNWNWLVKMSLDYIMMLIGIMLIICFVYVSYYTGHYFRGAIGRVTLSKMIKLFVGVMFILICTCDFLWTLVFWEYLGVVSFF